MSRMLLALALGIPVGVMAAGAGTDTDAKGTSGEVQPAAATGGKVSAGPAGQGSPEVSGAGARLLGAPTAKGYRIHAVALDYGKPLLSANHLDKGFRVDVAVDGKPVCSRSVERVYLNHAPSVGSRPSTGQHLILELDPFDSCAPAHEYRAENEAPMSFRTKDAQGKGVQIERKQLIRIPTHYGSRLKYTVHQDVRLKALDGETLDARTFSLTGEQDDGGILVAFASGEVKGDGKDNKLLYRLYKPTHAPSQPARNAALPGEGQQDNVNGQKSAAGGDDAGKRVNGKRYLVLALHGSGQTGKDNLAPLLSSRQAVATLDHEDGYVLVPQYDGVFDAADPQGGVHWQTPNRRALLLKLIDETLAAHPDIDRSRIYLNGLSRGGEGALYLMMDRPGFFAGALIMSGREAHSVDWMDGNATADNMKVLARQPIWFFHAVEDKVSPVDGTRTNVRILRDELKNPHVRYTELSFARPGDNGMLNDSAHNSWDMVYESPAAMQWLLQQRLETK